MRLKSLEIHGFKTFPDRTKLTFHHGFTAVVGPNGSGKSNISDAIRWVLGEQSTKNLRCSKMEDIVFSGTTSRKAHGYAEVTMTIENQNRELPFDGDLVSITRRYYRSGDGEYLINNATVRLKDIHELFMDTGLGRDGYSVIGQGKIDSIVSARSEERREIFEEAAGISRYRYRKEESERKLFQAEENLVRLHDIVSELEDRVEPLRIQSEKAKSYLEFYEEKRNLEIGLWLNTLERSGNVLREQEEKTAIARNQEEQVSAQLEEISREIEMSFNRANSYTVQMDEIRTKTSQAEALAARKEGEISVLENDMLHNNQSIERIKKELDLASLSHQSSEQELIIKKDRLKETEELCLNNHREQQSYIEKLESIRNDMNQSDSEIAQATQKLHNLTEQNSEIKLQQMVADSEMSQAEERQNTYVQQANAYQAQIEKLKSEEHDYHHMVADAKAQLESMAQEIETCQQHYQDCRKQLEQEKQIADRIILDINEQSRKIKFLENLESSLEGFHHSVKAVMNQAANGHLNGIHGPVSRLIEVPKQYAVALETALGASMQHIVVGNEQDAKQAILFLKQKEKGRATFLPMSTIKANKLTESGLDSCEGFIGIAEDLCQCDAQYRSVLQSLLGRIVVARNLDAATQIAKRYHYRFRIVTLDGQVVNAGGSMTGGSQARSAGLLSRSADIAQGKEKIAALEQQAAKAKETFQATAQRTIKAEQAIEHAKNMLYQRREETVQIQAEYNRVLNERKAIEEALRQLKSEQEQFSHQLEQQMQIKENTAAQLSKITDEITAVQTWLTQLTGSKESFGKESQLLNEQLQELRVAGVSIEKEKEALEKELEDLRQNRLNYDHKAEVLNSEIRAVTGANQLVKKQIAAFKEEVTSLREQAKSSKETIAKLTEERLQTEQHCAQLRTQEREKSVERENLGRELARLEERKANLQKEYDSIITKLWEEYELTRREAQALDIQMEDAGKAQRRLNELKSKIKALGTVNVAAIEEYQEVSERYEFLTSQIADVEKSRNELRKLIHDLIHQMKELFLERFEQINTNFKETFQTLFGGGKANLELLDSDNVLESGIGITVHPPGKIVTNVELLSGGEKALVAIALYFAIMKVSPPPFCILDEIEAALDDVNVSRFASYLRKMNDNTQFVTITHRRGTMEEADVLYGVTMQDQGVSKLLELDVSEIEEKLGL